jgi:predicted nuclease of restriction endonuclease-like (RecB) superfamily
MPPKSQDTKDVFRDTYILELLGLPKKHKERDLQSAKYFNS